MKAKRSVYNLLFNILSLVITFALGIIIPKLFILNLGSEANGLISSVGQIFSYVGLLEAGIGATVIQALYKPISENNKAKINQILTASGRYYKKIGYIYIGCIVLIAIVYPLIVSVDLPRWQVVGVICFSGLGNAINFLLQQNYVALLSAEGRGYVTTNLNLIVNVAVSLAKAFLLINNFNIVYVMGAQFFITLLRIVLMRIYIGKKYNWLNTKSTPDFQALGKQKYVLIQQLSYFVYTNTDIVILTFLGDLTLVSVYTLYNMIIGAVEGIVGAFTSSIVFALGQLYNEDFRKFKKVFLLFDSFYTTLVFSMFSVVYLCIIPFFSIYTRGITDVNYIDANLALLFVILKMVTTLRSQSQNTINFAGHFRETQKSSIIEAAMNIVVSIVGVYFWGIYGVILGSIVSSFYKGIVITNYANKNIIMLSTREKVIRYARWCIYILMFGCIYVFSKKTISLLVETYYDWIKLAILCTLIVCIIYSMLWILIDIRTAKDTVDIIRNRIQTKKEKNKTK